MRFYQKLMLGFSIAARVDVLKRTLPGIEKEAEQLLKEVREYAETQAAATPGLSYTWLEVDQIIKDIQKLV